MAAISWWTTTLDNVERLWPQGMCRGTLIWGMASPVMLFGPCILLCLWINIRYMSHFQNDSKNTLDLLDLRDKLPSKKADTDGRASWARRAPPRFGDERWFDFILFILFPILWSMSVMWLKYIHIYLFYYDITEVKYGFILGLLSALSGIALLTRLVSRRWPHSSTPSTPCCLQCPTR